MKKKANTPRADRQMAVLQVTRPGKILLPFCKRDIMPMKDCPDCKAIGILALNGNLFGCPRCRHYFA